jgi:hypothetical protein
MARSSGISSSTCTGCHDGGAGQTTTISTVPANFAPGATVSVRVRIAGSLSNGGLWLTNNGVGTFGTGANMKLSNRDIIQSSPKEASEGAVTFEVPWTAPSTKGGVLFTTSTVMGNGNGGSSGDKASNADFSVAYGCAGITFYRDYDNDGVGSVASGLIQDCAVPKGYSATAGDCDDNDERRNPLKPEICNSIDDNCDGQINEGLANATTWPDMDNDGYGAVNGVSETGCVVSLRASNNTDCDDNAAAVNPNAKENCNLKDDNCNGKIDEGARPTCGVGWCFRASPSCNPADCTPGVKANERCNGLDEDCNGVIDDGQNLCNGSDICLNANCVPFGTDASTPEPLDSGGTEIDAGLVFSSVDGGVRSKSGVVQGFSCQGSPGPLVFLLVARLGATRRKRSTPSH